MSITSSLGRYLKHKEVNSTREGRKGESLFLKRREFGFTEVLQCLVNYIHKDWFGYKHLHTTPLNDPRGH